MFQWFNFLTSPNSIVEYSQKTFNTLEREKKKGITHHHFNMHCHNAPTTVCSKFCQSTQINSKSPFFRLLLVKQSILEKITRRVNYKVNCIKLNFEKILGPDHFIKVSTDSPCKRDWLQFCKKKYMKGRKNFKKWWKKFNKIFQDQMRVLAK